MLAFLLLLLVLLTGAWLRSTGLLDWDSGSPNHPDETFMVSTTANIEPVSSLAEYFDTAASSLNPNNRGAGFYVYGTLPIFLVCYTLGWLDPMSVGITEIGRVYSALFDLGIVLLTYLIAARLYNRRVGLLGAAFSALAVMQIQQAHFYTTDNFANFFIHLALFAAVLIAISRPAPMGRENPLSVERRSLLTEILSHPWLLPGLCFGLALGLGAASKINAVAAAPLLPAAVLLSLSRLPRSQQERQSLFALAFLLIAAILSLLLFRFFQPYSFSGPSFWDFGLNPAWVSSMRELAAFSSRNVDHFPPAYQWARRPVWFALQNMVLWGFGPPLGLAAWAGWLAAGRRIFKGEWRAHLLLWGWVGLYFTWQALATNPTMRYQLPVYPGLTIFAAWLLVTLWAKGRARPRSGISRAQILTGVLAGLLLLATFAWAFAFTRIYTRPLTRVDASRWIYQNIPGPINLRIQTGQGLYNQPLAFPYGQQIQPTAPYSQFFRANATGLLSEIFFPFLLDHPPSLPEASKEEARKGEAFGGGPSEIVGEKTVLATVTSLSEAFPGSAQAAYTASFHLPEGPHQGGYLLKFEPHLAVLEGIDYLFSLEYQAQEGGLFLEGAAVATEGSWDWGLPFPVDGYHGYGGLYPLGLEFNMYDADSPEKLARMLAILDRSDYLTISSNRQYGSLPRLPERFPLSTLYYRSLLGCPSEDSIEWCYNVAAPGMFEGSLGFELAAVFQSNPTLGPIEVNDQFAEEAFTVYDHPKSFIFRKTPDYNPQAVQRILSQVDFDKIVPIPPLQAGSHPATLLLPEERLNEQRLGGTWSEIFDTSALQNRHPLLGVLLWYLALSVVGLVAYPIVRLALPGLSDRGYPLARLAGMLSLAYLAWMGGSFGIPFSRLNMNLCFALFALAGSLLAYRQRVALLEEWRIYRSRFLVVEALFLLTFLLALLLRLGNPDLWHPAFGGEKPMDFAYLNAVIKSTTFPPYDPWFAGGYINYYYYGFVVVGAFVKWLGIVPAMAYNLILPTLFSLIALGVFSVAGNIVRGRDWKKVGIFSILFMIVFGNLGTLQMILQGWQHMAAPGGVIEGAGILQRVQWSFQGLLAALGGQALPYHQYEWYWNPTRIIRPFGEVITEFPFFTVLYADLHAHLIALPISLLALAWAVSVVLGRGRWESRLGAGLSFLLAGLAIGALYPTNLSDIYTYLPLGLAALAYSFLRFFGLPTASYKWLTAYLPMVIASLVLLGALAIFLYQPYRYWYGAAYGSVTLWEGMRTPLSAYLLHWGFFLFILTAWLAWETRQWLALNRLSSLRERGPYPTLVLAIGLLGIILAIGLYYLGIPVALVALPLAAWASMLLLRRGQNDKKRIVLFLTITGLLITLMVEMVVARGDVGRMNTVFKFYLHSWTFFAISAAVALVWLLKDLPYWRPGWRRLFRFGLVFLFIAAGLYPLQAVPAKIHDRMEPTAPRTLDGMAYMQEAWYDWNGPIELIQDHAAIRWLQENVSGSPVIVEAHLPEYRWGGRISIYTGLPTVLGWNVHQRQQRALTPDNWIWERALQVEAFYTTTNLTEALDFLARYQVEYIILGQLERNTYPGRGLSKFENQNGLLWERVFEEREFTIYRVKQ